MTSTAPAAPRHSMEGTLIGGKFRIERVLGEGGMGVVYAAVHLDLRKHVAIKLIRDDLVQNREVVERMLNEARVAASLRSEHVARVLDVGTLESGAPFIVMEYLEGADLATMLAEDGPLPAVRAVDFMLQACEAVAEAHAAGIVHRDLKPDNVFIASGADGEPMAKVLDFGVSKVLVSEREAGALTNPSSLIGSPSYMAPESMQDSERAGPPADVWSLGAVLYELVSGVRPFDGHNLPETCAKVLATQPPPLTTLAPEAPKALEDVVVRCLEKDASRRLTILELAAALAPLGSADASAIVRRIERVSSGVRLKPRSLAPAGRIVTPASSVTPIDSTPPLATVRESREPAAPHTRRLQLRVAGGLALGACLVLGALGFTLRRGADGAPLVPAQAGIAARSETVLAATAAATSDPSSEDARPPAERDANEEDADAREEASSAARSAKREERAPSAAPTTRAAKHTAPTRDEAKRAPAVSAPAAKAGSAPKDAEAASKSSAGASPAASAPTKSAPDVGATSRTDAAAGDEGGTSPASEASSPPTPSAPPASDAVYPTEDLGARKKEAPSDSAPKTEAPAPPAPPAAPPAGPAPEATPDQPATPI